MNKPIRINLSTAASQREGMTVAVDFSPRFEATAPRVAKRRMTRAIARLIPHPSLRDGRFSWAKIRGLKSTATINSSLRDSTLHAPVPK